VVLRKNIHFEDKFFSILVWSRLRASNPYWGSGIKRWRRHHKIVNFFCVSNPKSWRFCFTFEGPSPLVCFVGCGCVACSWLRSVR